MISFGWFVRNLNNAKYRESNPVEGEFWGIENSQIEGLKNRVVVSVSFCLEGALTSQSAGGLGAACDIFCWGWRAWRWLCGPVAREGACWSPTARSATERCCPWTTGAGWWTHWGSNSAAAACKKPWIRLQWRESRRHTRKHRLRIAVGIDFLYFVWPTDRYFIDLQERKMCLEHSSRGGSKYSKQA